MREVKLDAQIVGDMRQRRFFVIKNDRGLYQDYTHHSGWTDKLCNALLYNSERGAIKHAQYMLEHKKLEGEGKAGNFFCRGFGKSFEKVYVVEIELREKND